MYRSIHLLVYLSLCILFYVSRGYESCWRKSGLYHDTGMVIQDDVMDKKASTVFKYLSIAEKKEQSRLLNTFNWTKIRNIVKDEFNKSCNLGDGNYMYNYSLIYETTVGGDYNDSLYEEYGFSTTVSPTDPYSKNINYNSTKAGLVFITSVLGLEEDDIHDYIVFNNSSASGFITFISHGKCNNITITEVVFSLVNTTGNGVKVEVYLKGVSVAGGNFSSSEDITSCIDECINNNTRYKVTVENGCEHCSMKFMASTVQIPKEFNDTIKEIGIHEDNVTSSFYSCNVNDEPDCKSFITLGSITSKITLSNIRLANNTRPKRSIISSVSSSPEEFDCKYLHYPDPDKIESCTVKVRRKRSDDPKKVSSDNNLLGYARQHLGSKPIIPPKVTHLQTGIDKKSKSGVSGDGAIYKEVKREVKDMIKKIAPVVPSSGKPEDLYAVVRKPPKIPHNIRKDAYTEAIKTTIQQKQSSISEVLYAELDFSGRRPPAVKTYGDTVYSTIEFSNRRESVSSMNSEPDFVDVTEVKRQLEQMRLGNTASGGRRRVSSSTSESDFEDIAEVRKYIESMQGGGMGHARRRMSSSSSDFEDVNQAVRDYNAFKQKTVMKKGMEPMDTSGNTIYKSLQGKTDKIKGVNIVKQYSPYDDPVMIKGVDTGSVVTTPLTRKGAIRRPKHSDSQPQLDDGIYFSPARVPNLDNSIYMEGPITGKPKHMSPSHASRPLPPIPSGNKDSLLPPVPPPRDKSLSPIREESHPSGAIPKSMHRRCRRNLDGVICSMLHSKPKDTTYSMAGDSSSPYSLVDKPRIYEEIGGIPKDNVNVMDKKTIVRGNSKKSGNSYKSNMNQLSSSFDKYMVFGGAMLLVGQQAAQQQARQSVIQRKDHMSEGEKIFEAVTMSLSSLGTTLTSAGIAGGPKVMAAGMAISVISGIIDTVKDIYYLFSNTEKPIDPVVKLFNTYSGLISDRDRAGVRKCMVPGEDMMIYMSYSNNSKNFKPDMEKTALYFLDVIDSEVLYMNTSNLILDYQLRVACPIGVLRSPDTDITAYTTMYAEDDGVKKYIFTRLGVMLSRTPTVRLTCGRDTTLTIRPYEVPISDMQLLKMATPGEPNSTKSIPSDVCDKYPLKKFYLLAEGCPYDTSQSFIVHTTCSILLRMSTWDPFRNRWVLQNPFRQEGEYKQLFTFSKYDFNDTIIDPNNKPGHASFCINRQARQCYWSESMVLEDVTSCQAKARKIYVKMRVFGDRGFDSFILTCPSGSTPVSIDSDSSILEIPVGDYGTSKLFASTEDNKRIGVFCMHNYDTRYKSDIIVLLFEKNKFDYGIKQDNLNSREILFSRMSVGMPYRSIMCDNRRKECKIGGVDFSSPDIEMEIHHSSKEIMLKETYDANSIDPQVVNKSKKYFPAPIKVTFPVNNLGNAYRKPDKFWTDAINKKRTYSSILVNIAPCTSRNKNIYIDNPISTMGYLQSITKDYGDGSHYYFTKVKPTMYNAHNFMFRDNANCSAVLNLKSRDMTVECDTFSIPRSSIRQYEGLCFIVVTSRDHCATETEWLKEKGYNDWDANQRRTCLYDRIKNTVSSDHYCSYSGDLYNYYPIYDACKSYMFIEYKDAWVESEVLQQPPYTFEFVYDKNNNEYIDKELSDRMNDLYEQYKKLIEYTDGSLPNSINRLAKALTKEGREIARVNIDGNVLELAYQADREKIMEIQEKISEITKEIFVHTLSENDLKEIMEFAENSRCCLIDVHNNKTEKYYPIDKYICGEVSDYVYTDEEDRKYVLINNTYISYDYLNQSEAVVCTCYNASIIPLDTEEARKMAEDAIISSAIAEALNDIFDEMDTNISLALMNEEERYLSFSGYNNTIQIGCIIIIVLIILIIVSVLTYTLYKKHKKYNIINSKYIRRDDNIELDSASYVSLSDNN
ncbi:SWPV1-115 [Shearwaterpox virus]|uniref:SWPV1-115 n=1 Tax=Shearwaterpox virus TaxID=1974596 RepID=A0A1V0S7V6_CNPV|nr:SWPV1-115 [Shearwaterpox virus]